jgi:class 3 adenylate cyclase/tetratricopeptide (TPR) repeat protein
VKVCPSCGHENRSEARFCESCGASLTDRPTPEREERKIVTVLFCDLVGFTAASEAADPENARSRIRPYHARLRKVIEGHGGTVEKFIGDAVMAVFGAPVAHEDDAERAVRAGLRILEAIEKLNEQDPALSLRVRIGINTGEAVVVLESRPKEGEGIVTGDVVNTASRVQAAAPVDGILVSERTHDATKDAIEYEKSPPVVAKGKSKPIPVRRALRARSRIALVRPHATPFVGRTRELSLLTDALAHAHAERQPQLVTLVGVPGIGKSRLVYELSRAADREPELIAWRQGRCLPYGEGVTFWALAEIVKGHAGILDTDSVEQAERKLRDVAPEYWIFSQLRPLVGLGSDGDEDGDRREESFVAWRSFLEGIAAERPLVLIFEDFHWADRNLVDFIDHLVDWASGVPLLVVCTARPELLDERPGWGGGKTNALTISLSALSDEETARLVGGLIQRAVLPAETQEALLVRAGGNPLYAEQYARLLEEAEGLPLPESVQAIIAARLDALAPEQKALLQDAAVVGKSFWLGAITSISGEDRADATGALHALERRGFVRRERESSIEGDTEYAFLHVLIRDVAYGQITRVRRADKHRLAAAWLAGLGRSEDQAELLAHHYGEALELARAARGDTSALEEPARRALRDAGDRALTLGAFQQAQQFYERALAVWPADDPERPRVQYRRARAYFHGVDETRSDLIEEARDALIAAHDHETAAEATVLLAWSVRSAGRASEAVEFARAAAELLENAPPSAAKTFVLANWARMLFIVAGQDVEGAEVARRALVMAEELGLEEVKANALATAGYARVQNDDFDGITDMEAGLQLTLEHGSPFEITRVHNNLLFAYWAAGRVQDAKQLLPRYLELNERYGLSTLFPQGVAAGDAYSTGAWDEAAQRLDEMPLQTPHSENSVCLCLRARMRLARDDLVGAVQDCAKALELPADKWEVGALEHVLCASALVALADGRARDAGALADRIITSWTPRNSQFADSTEIALLFDALGRRSDAILDAAEARPNGPWLQVARAVARGELVYAADRLAELDCATVEAAVRLRAAARLVAERRAEADVQLQKALNFYRSVDATRHVREGEALLAATA